MNKVQMLDNFCKKNQPDCHNCPIYDNPKAHIICLSYGFNEMDENQLTYLIGVAGLKDKKEINDNVEHPKHYCSGKFECFDVMREIYGDEAVKAFSLGNAFKHLYRCKHKNNELEDVKKARWYIDKLIELGEQDDESKT